ncbi:MAG TPA: hypothetical protein VFB58_11025 [Chloroflexota bacterium]|nr:hypothetical protein [Chloroflexota bacterium]
MRREITYLTIGLLAGCVIAGTSSTHAQRSASRATRVLTVSELQARCVRGTAVYNVRVRGYYAVYAFFGPGPPATPITYQTGYLYGHKVRTPMDRSASSSGILVIGPRLGSGTQLPASGWVQIAGRWDCASARLRVRSWKPSLALSGTMPSNHLHAQTVTRGIRFTLSLTGRVYSPNTLAPVELGMTNVSHHPIRVVRANPPFKSPYAAILDDAGQIVYPPTVPDTDYGWGIGSSPQRTLQPGQSIYHRDLVVLRGSRLEATGVILPRGASNLSWVQLASRPLRLDLDGTEPAPTAVLTGNGTAADVAVTSRVPVAGRLYYQYTVDCRNGMGAGWAPVTWTWQSVAGTTIHLTAPDKYCTQVLAWHVVAGWIGHPTVFVQG